MDSVVACIETPERIVEKGMSFSIPSYQRPYVWPDESVTELFKDLYSAWIDELPHYYVGTILTANHDDEFELIDGQQRTTTLMLLALSFKRKSVDTKLVQLICDQDRLRLSFSIRESVQDYIGFQAGLDGFDHGGPSDAEIKDNPYLKRMAACIKLFDGLLDQLIGKSGESMDEARFFGDYIFSNLHFINNQIPVSTDLNQLFATMNNSGVQLEQTDILKALLLKNINSEKSRFNAMWQACENLDNYFERNVRRLFPSSKWETMNPHDFSVFDPEKFVFEGTDEVVGNSLTITDIVNPPVNGVIKLPIHDSNNKYNLDEESESELYCRSVISFSQLLLHAYRIYLHQDSAEDFSHRFHSDHLLHIFDSLIKAEEMDVKRFIDILWRVRYQFDSWVVKWVEQDDEDGEHLERSSVSGSLSGGNYYFNRSMLGQTDLSMLQSVRYFVADRNSQYWMTPLLGWLINQPGKLDRDTVLHRLESIDNQLSLSLIEQKPASYRLIDGDLSSAEIMDIYQIQTYLNESKGTGFKHYWFQKLEYLLWKEHDDSGDEQFKRYRIVSRNSVEHVHPQHEEYGRKLGGEYLDSFGNLALLNPGQNSSYSNQTVKKKKADFESKLSYDSLKLKKMFELMSLGDWDVPLIERHQVEMINLISRHYQLT